MPKTKAKPPITPVLDPAIFQDLTTLDDKIDRAIQHFFGAHRRRIGITKPIHGRARWIWLTYTYASEYAFLGATLADYQRVVSTRYGHWHQCAIQAGYIPTTSIDLDPAWLPIEPQIPRVPYHPAKKQRRHPAKPATDHANN